MQIHSLISTQRRNAAAVCAAGALLGLLAATTLHAASPPPVHAAATAVTAAASAPHATSAAKKRKPAAPVKLVDINSASRTELKKLPGVGDAEADKIIANRPFLSKAELVTKGVMPAGPYLTLKTRVIAMQRSMPKPAPVAASQPTSTKP